MKLVYESMGHILKFGEGYVSELIVENKKLFFEMVNDALAQVDGAKGGFVLSINDQPVEFSKNADVTVQLAPFKLNKKSLLTKLYSALEERSTVAELYAKTAELLCSLEAFIYELAEELPFEVECKKVAIGPVIRALSPEFEEEDKSALEKIFDYMELVRELDRDRIFIMVNMRTYFSDSEMEQFTKSAVLHDFNVLLLESVSFPPIANTKRYIIDEDLCEI